MRQSSECNALAAKQRSRQSGLAWVAHLLLRVSHSFACRRWAATIRLITFLQGENDIYWNVAFLTLLMFGVSSLEEGHLVIIRVSGRRGRALQSPVFATTKGVSPDSQLPKGSEEKDLPMTQLTAIRLATWASWPSLDLPQTNHRYWNWCNPLEKPKKPRNFWVFDISGWSWRAGTTVQV